jgi:hypothetical protein
VRGVAAAAAAPGSPEEADALGQNRERPPLLCSSSAHIHDIIGS